MYANFPLIEPTQWRSGKSARFTVGRPVAHFPSPIHIKSLLKMLSTAFLFGVKKVVKNQLASSLVVSLGNTLNETLPPLCGRQVAQFPSKRRLVAGRASDRKNKMPGRILLQWRLQIGN